MDSLIAEPISKFPKIGEGDSKDLIDIASWRLAEFVSVFEASLFTFE